MGCGPGQDLSAEVVDTAEHVVRSIQELEPLTALRVGNPAVDDGAGLFQSRQQVHEPLTVGSASGERVPLGRRRERLERRLDVLEPQVQVPFVTGAGVSSRGCVRAPDAEHHQRQAERQGSDDAAVLPGARHA